MRTDAIYVSTNGELKLFDRKLVVNRDSAYEMAKSGDTGAFLTPIEFAALGKNAPEPVHDRYKADVFSLGMTLLELGTFKRSASIYDWNNYTLNMNTLSDRLMELRGRYSSHIYELIREMLRFEDRNRPDFIILKEYMNCNGPPMNNLNRLSLSVSW